MAIEKKNSPVRSCFGESPSPVHLQAFLSPWLLALNAVYAPKTKFEDHSFNHRADFPADFMRALVPLHLPSDLTQNRHHYKCSPPRHQIPLYLALMSRQYELRPQLPPRIRFTQQLPLILLHRHRLEV